MTKKDTILLAALINAGLLVVLFATAMTGEPVTQTQLQPPQALTQVVAPKKVETAAVVVEKPKKTEPVAVQSPFPDGIEPVATAVIPKAKPIAEVPSNKTEAVDVVVKRGDSLDKIARANGTTIEAIMEVNQLTSTRLQIGTVLQVPCSKRPIQAKKTTSDVVGEYYTIASGDSPWSVAVKFRIPLDQLLTMNDLDEEAARKLRPGDRIRIR